MARNNPADDAHATPGPAGPNGENLIYPVGLLMTDFSLLLADADRLISDVRSVLGDPKPSKPNGERRTLPLDAAISSLTERARAFVDSWRRYQALYDHAPIPYVELDRKGVIVRMNAECARLLDHAASRVLGSPVTDCVAESDAARLRRLLQQCRNSRRPNAMRATLTKGGMHAPVEICVCSRHGADKEEGFFAVIRKDSSASSEAGRAAQDIRSEFTAQLNGASTVDSVLKTCAAYCRRVMGAAAGGVFFERKGRLEMAAQWRSKRVSIRNAAPEFVRNARAVRVFESCQPRFWRHSRGAGSFALLPLTAKGRAFGVLALVFPNRGNSPGGGRSEAAFVASASAAAFARARAYDEAQAARREAEQSSRFKEEFLAMLAHELRNPLAPILGWSVALSSRRLDADKQTQAVDAIVRNVRALNYLIEDLLDVSRIHAGKLRLEYTAMRIQEVARDALAAVQQAAEDKKLRVSTDISEAVPPLHADPRRVRQILMNLLSNAVKFTPPGGTVSLRIARKGECVECAVSDTGQGIEPHFLPFVFDRFRQESRRKARKLGLGLGLSIVRELVELHGGAVRAHSAGRGMGATFTVRLPFRRPRKDRVRARS